MWLLRLVNTLCMCAHLTVASLIIGITATKLNKINLQWQPTTFSANVIASCELGTTAQGVNLCYAAYTFSGASVLATAALAALRCCTCNVCSLGYVLDIAFSALGTAWWGTCAVLFNHWQGLPEVRKLPAPDLRHRVGGLCLAAFGVFLLSFIINIWWMVYVCCCCCRGGGGGAAAVAPGGAAGGERGGRQTGFLPAALARAGQVYVLPIQGGLGGGGAGGGDQIQLLVRPMGGRRSRSRQGFGARKGKPRAARNGARGGGGGGGGGAGGNGAANGKHAGHGSSDEGEPNEEE